MKHEFPLARYADWQLPSSDLHTAHPSSAVKIDEKQVLLDKARSLLPMFRKMGYAERRDYAKYNIELYVLLVELEQQSQTAEPIPIKDNNGKARFEKMTNAQTGEVTYYYIPRKGN